MDFALTDFEDEETKPETDPLPPMHDPRWRDLYKERARKRADAELVKVFGESSALRPLAGHFAEEQTKAAERIRDLFLPFDEPAATHEELDQLAGIFESGHWAKST